jgi:DNA-binding NarL/FixJ family response regulator
MPVPRIEAQSRAGGSSRRGAHGTIGIVVAMESRIAREGVTMLLRAQNGFRVLGEAGTGAETLSLCTELRPRVLLLSTLIRWPTDVSGIGAIRVIAPETRILAISPHGADRCALLNPRYPDDSRGNLGEHHTICLQVALSRGALGAVNQDASVEDFFQAVRAVAAGERWISPGIAVTSGDGELLSSRECAVARLIGQGRSNKEISRSLEITELTVKKHVANVLHKLGFHDRLQLGLCVARHPLLFAGDPPSTSPVEPREH